MRRTILHHGEKCKIECSLVISYKIATERLFALNRFEQRLEVSSTESSKVVPLDDLDEHCWSVHQVLSEQLKKISTLIKVNKDIKLLECLKILVQHHALLL